MTTLRAALDAPEHSPDCALLQIPSRDCDCYPALPPEPCGWVYINRATGERTYSRHMAGFVNHTEVVEVPVYAEPVANQTKTSGSPIQPVACLMQNLQSGDLELAWNDDGFDRAVWYEIPLYTHPPRREWQGLTDDELTAFGVIHSRHQEESLEAGGWFDFARAIEAALKEKNA